MILSKEEILKLYNKSKEGGKSELIIRPLLSEEQIGEVTVDLRLGGDFLITFQGRESFIDATGDENSRPIGSFFQETRRLVGESFYLHPHQTVLASTLEYIKLPEDIFLTITSRSSYSRLGLTLSSLVQPGYCGCIPIELTNNNNTPIKLLVGASIVQARFNKISADSDYFSKPRKYSCQVRPMASKVDKDPDIDKLKKLFYR